MTTDARSGLALICYAAAAALVGAFLYASSSDTAHDIGGAVVFVAGVTGLVGLVRLGRSFARD